MKRLGALLLALILVLGVFSACGSDKQEIQPESQMEQSEEQQAEPVEPSEPETEPMDDDLPEDLVVKVAGMKGPTGIGMAHLIDENENGNTQLNYDFLLEGAADAVMGKLINGELDIAAVPVNAASVLYNKTDKDITLLGVNTLGVLHILTNGAEINSISDLEGKTIYSTGQGTTPEYTLKYILEQNGLNPDEDVEIIYETEAAALQTKLAAGEIEIAVLPEPMVSAVTGKNEDVKIALDITEEWSKVTDGTVLTTGGVVVRNEFLEQYPQAVEIFIDEYSQSCSKAEDELQKTAELVVKNEILASEEIALKAIPRCNIVFMGGSEMKAAVSEYLEVLYNANVESVGGSLPDEDFYYGA